MINHNIPILQTKLLRHFIIALANYVFRPRIWRYSHQFSANIIRMPHNEMPHRHEKRALYARAEAVNHSKPRLSLPYILHIIDLASSPRSFMKVSAFHVPSRGKSTNNKPQFFQLPPRLTVNLINSCTIDCMHTLPTFNFIHHHVICINSSKWEIANKMV